MASDYCSQRLSSWGRGILRAPHLQEVMFLHSEALRMKPQLFILFQSLLCYARAPQHKFNATLLIGGCYNPRALTPTRLSVVENLALITRAQPVKLIDTEYRSPWKHNYIWNFRGTRWNYWKPKEKCVDRHFSGAAEVNVNTVERINRLGKKDENRARPIIMSLFAYKEKMEIY